MRLPRRPVRCRDPKPHVLAITTILTAAARYCRAAQRDEHRGYAYAAAFQWRKAAELLTPMPAIADQCWNQWERLMQLPRRLAAPIGTADSPAAELPASAAASSS
jgi:hypothetical protein